MSNNQISINTFYCDKVRSYWDFEPFENFGDILNPFIFSFFGVKLICDCETPKLYAIGSIISTSKPGIDRNAIVWSSGSLFDKKYSLARKPIAFRGKLTRNNLQTFTDEEKNTIPLGDGALILSKLYTPKPLERRWKLGIMPHYVDIVYNERDRNPLTGYPIFSNNEVVFIDVRKPVEDTIKLMNSCDNIIASCLHGLVVCDSYKIKHSLFSMNPSYGIMHDGAQQSFKFKDYYSAFDIDFKKPDFTFDRNMTMDQCISYCKEVNKPQLENIQETLLKLLKNLTESWNGGEV
jgi:pyruvyltransferase